MPKLNKLDFRIVFQIFILLVVSVVCFLPALDSFFVADDIWQVNFAHKVLDGRTELIWRNFTSNYLQLPSFGFYRPLLGFTFISDYFLYGVNAVGYHVTSIILYLITVFMFFALIRRLTRAWPDFNSSWTAFFSALLFAVSPLHCEDVTWISGRADLLSAPFYLLSFYLIVKARQEGRPRLYWFSLASFAASLLSKEIAIGLPVLVAAYYFIWPEEEKFSEPVEAPVVDNTETVPKPVPVEPTRQEKASAARQAAHLERAVKKGKKKKKKKQGTTDGALLETDSEAPADAAPGTAGVPPAPNPAGTESRPKSKLLTNFLNAAKMSLPFLAISGAYLVLRYQALGEFIGGYGGMMGGALGRHLLLRWFDPVNIQRIILPFPQSITTNLMLPQWVLGICLVTCLCIVLVRFLAQSNPIKWVFFLFIWMATAIVPLAKLWGVGLELETSRLLFFFTFPYSALWPVLVFYPPKFGAKFKIPAVANRNLGLVSSTVFLVMAITLGWATFKTNSFWTVAGHELKNIWRATVKLAEPLGKDEKIIVLGIPKDYKGAHVNFNGSTFHHMLRPPFTIRTLADKVITFEPFIIGPYEVINSDRLKAMMMSSKQFKGPYVWDRETAKYEKIDFGGQRGMPESIELPFRTTDSTNPSVGKSIWRYDGKGTSEIRGDGIVMHNTDDGAALKIENLDVSPLEFDFIEFDISAAMKPDDKRALVPMAVGWNSLSVKTDRFQNWSVLALNVPKLREKSPLRLHLSHFWQWYSAGTIKSFVMRLFDADKIEISNVRLVKARRKLPFAGLKDLVPLNTGEYVIGNEPIMLLFDGTNIPDAQSAEIEVTKPNYFFDNYLMGSGESAVSRVLKVDLTRGATLLRPNLFPEPAYYEIHVRCLDKNRKPVGAWSEPVTVLKMGEGLETYIK